MQPDWSKATNFVEGIPILPTVITDQDGTLLSLVWSSERSLKEAMERKLGIYESRRRGRWVKSPSGVNQQRLLSVAYDCDGDALHFCVAQRGEACHLERKSCFDQIWSECETLRIGISSGRGKESAIELLQKVGIHLYSKANARSTEYLCKTHLHPEIEIVECKPRDLEPLLKSKVIQIAVGFSDQFKESWQIRTSDSAKEVPIVVYGQQRKRYSKVFTEYPIADWPTWKKFIANDPVELIEVSGNAEAFVAQHPDAIGVGVVDSGKTLRANGLTTLCWLKNSKVGIYFSDEIYKLYPRLFRSITNDLQDGVIYFYSVDGPHGFMSNFYPTKQRSSEHHYQAGKFLDSDHQQLILSQATAKEAYKMAWRMKEHWRSDWEKQIPCDLDVYTSVCGIQQWEGDYLVKDQVMWKALLEKFSDPDLRAKLDATGDRQLVEHALRDAHFGCGIDGKGFNVLGRMLMVLRTLIRESVV